MPYLESIVINSMLSLSLLLRALIFVSKRISSANPAEKLVISQKTAKPHRSTAFSRRDDLPGNLDPTNFDVGQIGLNLKKPRQRIRAVNCYIRLSCPRHSISILYFPGLALFDTSASHSLISVDLFYKLD